MINGAIFTTHLAVKDPTPEGVRNKGKMGETSMHHVKIHGSGQGIGISLDGCVTGEGEDQVVWIEHYEGEWAVRVWGDGEKADPTHVIIIKKLEPEGQMG